MPSLSSVVAFLNANTWVYYLLTGVLTFAIHQLKDKSPRVVMFLQAISLDTPKMWTAVTGNAPPPGFPPAAAAPPAPPAPAAPPSTSRTTLASVASAFGLCLALGSAGCGGAPAPAVTAATVIADVQTGLEEAQRVCALTRALSGVNEPKAVAVACGIAEAAYPALEKLLDELEQATKAAARIKAAGK